MSDTREYRLESRALDTATVVALLSELPFDAFAEEGEVTCAYLAEDAATAELDAEIEAVAARFDLRLTRVRIADRNWNQVWEENFAPAEIGSFLRIRAPFHASSEAFEHELEIVPEMSFGTGHHETTHMMVELLREGAPFGKTVLDFGTGTGILAMVARRLGASRVVATDYDPRCIASTLANAARNQIHLDLVALGDAHSLPDERFDRLLANVQRSVLIPAMPALAQRLTPDGQLWMSGILEADMVDLDRAAVAAGLRMLERRQRGKWLALRYGPNQPL